MMVRVRLRGVGTRGSGGWGDRLGGARTIPYVCEHPANGGSGLLLPLVGMTQISLPPSIHPSIHPKSIWGPLALEHCRAGEGGDLHLGLFTPKRQSGPSLNPVSSREALCWEGFAGRGSPRMTHMCPVSPCPCVPPPDSRPHHLPCPPPGPPRPPTVAAFRPARCPPARLPLRQPHGRRGGHAHHRGKRPASCKAHGLGQGGGTGRWGARPRGWEFGILEAGASPPPPAGAGVQPAHLQDGGTAARPRRRPRSR